MGSLLSNRNPNEGKAQTQVWKDRGGGEEQIQEAGKERMGRGKEEKKKQQTGWGREGERRGGRGGGNQKGSWGSTGKGEYC